MNKGTAIRANTVLCWMLGLPVNGEPVREHDLRAAATALAAAVQRELSGGVTPADVERHWGDRAPRVILGSAYVLRLDPREVRIHFEDDECLDCTDGTEHECDRTRLDGVTDDQLARAADKVLNRDNPLDEGITPTFEQIASLAQEYATREAATVTP